MRCMNCGLPLSPGRNLTNCPRCGVPLNTVQGVQQQPFEQPGWGQMGGAPQQNPWGQATPPGTANPFNQPGTLNSNGLNGPGMVGGFNGGVEGGGWGQMGLPPRQPISAKKNKSNPRVLFIVAGLCILLGAVLLGVIAMIVFSSSGKTTNSANTNGNTPANGGTTPQAVASPSASDTGASPTADASPSASGTPYPGQQYIDSAQMVTSDPATTPNQQPTTTFKVGSNMYVTFKLHPPSQGGAVCSYWYLGGKQVTSYVSAVKRSSHSSYTYAIYGNPGQAYVELYWASDKSCSGKILAQHVDFTVTG